jgi:hypothetical protein
MERRLWNELRTSRTEAEQQRCSRCGAKPGEKCQGVRGVREASHQERHTRAWEARPR